MKKISELSPDEGLRLANEIARVCQPDYKTSLLLIEEVLSELENASFQGIEIDTWRQFFQALWKFQKAIKLVIEEKDFIEAQSQFKDAKVGFDLIEQNEFFECAIGLEYYMMALIEVQNQNLSKGLELLDLIKTHFKKAGEFGSKYDALMLGMNMDIFSTAGVRAVQNLELDSAKGFFESASQAAEKMALEHKEKDSLEYFSALGFHHYYKALYEFYWAFVKLNEFDYDSIFQESNLTMHAEKAIEFLNLGDKSSKINLDILHISQGIVEILGVIVALSKRIECILSSTIKLDLEATDNLKKKVRLGSELILRAGPTMVPLVKMCNDLTVRLDNLERLSKPNKKDFGIYSGLISVACFAFLLILVAWVNDQFSLNLEFEYLYGIPVVLGLIGGFGFGALKFKSLLPWINKNEEN